MRCAASCRARCARKRLGGHILRGSIAAFGTFCFIGAYSRLPVVDVTAITFLSPLITVVFAALFLKERVHIYRWTAVIVGFSGVHLDAGAASWTGPIRISPQVR